MRGKRLQFCVLLAGAIGLAGCDSFEPLEVTPNSEMRPGQGLFTGEQGSFYLVGDERRPLPSDNLPPRGEN